MDKYEFKLKLDEIETLAGEKNYAAAAEIADSINWKKVRNVNSLMLVGEVYQAATIDGGSIYAEKLSDEAKDGQISLDTVENKYLVELNQASEMAIAVDANGNFVKNGVPLERAFAVHQNGQKVYKVYTLDENGVYVDASGKKQIGRAHV